MDQAAPKSTANGESAPIQSAFHMLASDGLLEGIAVLPARVAPNDRLPISADMKNDSGTMDTPLGRHERSLAWDQVWSPEPLSIRNIECPELLRASLLFTSRTKRAQCRSSHSTSW